MEKSTWEVFWEKQDGDSSSNIILILAIMIVLLLLITTLAAKHLMEQIVCQERVTAFIQGLSPEDRLKLLDDQAKIARICRHD